MHSEQAVTDHRTYLVRAIESQRIVGIFCARGSAELFRLVDEQVDPEECEYFEMRAGEGMFFDAQFVELPLACDDEDANAAEPDAAEPLYELDVDAVDEEALCGPQMTSYLLERLNDDGALLGWQLFTEHDVQGD